MIRKESLKNVAVAGIGMISPKSAYQCTTDGGKNNGKV